MHDTTAINRRLHRFEGHESVWLFGYGSLIWKADFEWLERKPARIHSWVRRFWQGSHDHRGTPEAPGRVATLVPFDGGTCAGMAYRITPAVFDHLDEREKNGYLRTRIRIEFTDGSAADGLVYVGSADNAAFLGPAEDAELARHIASARGPSGLNREYFERLVEALAALGERDPHLEGIARELERLDRKRSGA